MITGLFRWILYALALILVAWIVPGIVVANFWSAMLACIIIAIINAVIKPIIQAISLPLNFLTLGLFTFIINALLLMLAGAITPGLEVTGFWSALFGSLILSFLSVFISKI